MIRGLPYPSAAEVDAASREELRYWLNNLPGDANKEHHALIQRIVDRLAEFRANPYAPGAQKPRKTLAMPAHSTPPPAPKPAKKAPAPAPVEEPADLDYFKSLFHRS